MTSKSHVEAKKSVGYYSLLITCNMLTERMWISYRHRHAQTIIVAGLVRLLLLMHLLYSHTWIIINYILLHSIGTQLTNQTLSITFNLCSVVFWPPSSLPPRCTQVNSAPCCYRSHNLLVKDQILFRIHLESSPVSLTTVLILLAWTFTSCSQ